MRSKRLSGISTRFQALSQTIRQVTHVLLTRPPLTSRASSLRPLDLHVLGTPPAFVLSQDQTLNKSLYTDSFRSSLHSFSFQGSIVSQPKVSERQKLVYHIINQMINW